MFINHASMILKPKDMAFPLVTTDSSFQLRHDFFFVLSHFETSPRVHFSPNSPYFGLKIIFRAFLSIYKNQNFSTFAFLGINEISSCPPPPFKGMGTHQKNFVRNFWTLFNSTLSIFIQIVQNKF